MTFYNHVWDGFAKSAQRYFFIEAFGLNFEFKYLHDLILHQSNYK